MAAALHVELCLGEGDTRDVHPSFTLSDIRSIAANELGTDMERLEFHYTVRRREGSGPHRRAVADN